jgi:hypothetical protein
VGLAGRYCLNDSIAGPCDFRSDKFQKVWYMFDRSRTRFRRMVRFKSHQGSFPQTWRKKSCLFTWTIFFSSPELFQQMLLKQIYCCGTVCLNWRGMPVGLTNFKKSDICLIVLAPDFMTKICKKAAQHFYCAESKVFTSWQSVAHPQVAAGA